MKIPLLLGLSGFFPLHPMMITSAERLRRKRAREILLASQKTDTEAAETKVSWLQWAKQQEQGQSPLKTLVQSC